MLLQFTSYHLLKSDASVSLFYRSIGGGGVYTKYIRIKRDWKKKEDERIIFIKKIYYSKPPKKKKKKKIVSTLRASVVHIALILYSLLFFYLTNGKINFRK